MNRRTILLPLDGSPFSRQILPYIQSTFRPEEYELTIIRAARPGTESAEDLPPSIFNIVPSPGEPERVMYDKMKAYSTHQGEVRAEELEHLRRELDEDVRILMADGYRVTVAVHFGDPGREIVKFAELVKVDMVAMATHGRTGLTHLLLGSVAEHVIRNVDVPVFLVRPENA